MAISARYPALPDPGTTARRATYSSTPPPTGTSTLPTFRQRQITRHHRFGSKILRPRRLRQLGATPFPDAAAQSLRTCAGAVTTRI